MESSLKWQDYLILVSFLVISLAIGLYHSMTGGRQKTIEEFIMADRRLKVIPTAISLLVSYQSAILVLGMTAEMYSYGPQFVFLGFFAFIANVLIVERIFVPWLYPLKLVSVNEYCYLRFGSNAVRIFASLLAITGWIMYMGMSMFAPSAVLHSVTGLPLWVSVPSMSLVCISYTALGGMRAVIWTDVFQFLTMVAGMLAIIIQGTIAVGGLGNVIQYAKDEGRSNLVDWSLDPTVRLTFWGIMIGGTVQMLPTYSISQAAVQRYSATKSLSNARLTVLLSIPGNVFVEALAGITGLVVFAYYAKVKCDPMKNKEIYNENQILPHFVVTLFGNFPGFAGLFIATLFGGALSSVSSALSASAANCWQDILERKFSHLQETKKTIINRILVIVFGIIAITVSFLASAMPGPMIQITMTLSGSVVGPLFGIYLLGGLSRLPNWKGALIGGLVGLSVSLWVNIGAMTVSNKYPSLPPLSTDGCSRNQTSFIPLYDDNFTLNASSSTVAYETQSTIEHHGIDRFYCLSYIWYVFLGSLVTVLVGFVVSLITRDREMEKAVEDRLLIRFRAFCCSWSSYDVQQKKDNDNEEMGKDSFHHLEETKLTSSTETST